MQRRASNVCFWHKAGMHVGQGPLCAKGGRSGDIRIPRDYFLGVGLFIPIPFLYRSYYPVQENQFDILPSYGTRNIFSLLPDGNLRHMSTLICSPALEIYEQSLPLDRQDKTDLNHLHLSIAHAS